VAQQADDSDLIENKVVRIFPQAGVSRLPFWHKGCHCLERPALWSGRTKKDPWDEILEQE